MEILSVAHALPSLQVTNQDLIDEIIEKCRKRFSMQEISTLERRIRRFFNMSGTETRYHRAKGERAFDFAMKAGRRALEKAGVSPKDVDLLIYAGVGRGWVEPATANLFQSELGLRRATCFDVLDACASWIRSLSIAKSFLDQAAYKLVMILNCEFNFREYANFDLKSLDDLENTFSAFTIGEAATATLLTSDEVKAKSAQFSFRTWGEKHGLCKIPLPNADNYSSNGSNGIRPMTFFTAPGELLSFTVRKLVNHVKETSSIASETYDLIIGHAVSSSATRTVIKLLKFDLDRVFETHPRFGNTVSASLPLALSVADDEGRLQRGMRVLLLMGSGGGTTGICSFEY